MIEVAEPLASTLIASLEFDDETDTCTVTFTHGGQIQYLNLAKQTFRRWTLSDSWGGFYNRHIKGKYLSADV